MELLEVSWAVGSEEVGSAEPDQGYPLLVREASLESDGVLCYGLVYLQQV